MACIIEIKKDLNNSIDKILGGYRDGSHSYYEAQRRAKEINARWADLATVSRFGNDIAKIKISDSVFEKVANESFDSQKELESELDDELGAPVEESTDEVFDNNIIDVSTIKPGVEDLFEFIPDLVDIGTQEQYSQYLDTIFPNSRVKDIITHLSKVSNIEKFKINPNTQGNFINSQVLGSGVYFASPDSIDYWSMELGFIDDITGTYTKNRNVYFAILNSKSPEEFQRNYIEDNDVKKETDVVINQSRVTGKREEYVVKDPDIIYILGSEQDKNNFKQYVDAISAEVVEEEHPIQTAYKAQLEKTGEKPKMIIITGTKAILNSNGTYDLVDPSNNTIMQKNMDLDTMEIIDVPDTSMPYDDEIFDNFVKNTLMHPYTEVMLAERGIDINDVFNELSVITTENELNEIMGKILKSVC